ncbi:hypothetical protein [Spirosoma arcticum]
MKPNTATITRPLVTAALLLTLFIGLSSCESTEPVKPKSAYGPIGPAVIPDTLVADPPVVIVEQPSSEVLIPRR